MKKLLVILLGFSFLFACQKIENNDGKKVVQVGTKPAEQTDKVSNQNQQNLSLNNPGENSQNNQNDDHAYSESNYDFVSISIVDVNPATASKLMRLAVKKNKFAVFDRHMLKKELEDLETREQAYYESIQQNQDPESAIVHDLDQVLEVTDPVLKDLYSKKDNIIRELRNLDALEKTGYQEIPDLAVLAGGFSGNTLMLAIKTGDPYKVVSKMFSPEMVKNHPILVIPTGALCYPLENLEVLSGTLSEYVKNGGTLIVFAQKHGNELSILPVPQEPGGSFRLISGKGYTEDISSFANAVTIEEWPPFLAGQDTNTPNMNIDGYFTSYPSAAKVLLSKTSNGMPAMLMYEYGQGKVIITSIFSDWAFAHKQASKDEISLFRDLISWAKKPAELPTVSLGETIFLSFKIENKTKKDATKVKLTLVGPNKDIMAEQLLEISVPAGQTALMSYKGHMPENGEIGIWFVDYTLLDTLDNIIQPRSENDSGRIAVKTNKDIQPRQH